MAAASGAIGMALLFSSNIGIAGAAAIDDEAPMTGEEPQAVSKPAPVIVISSYETSKKRLVAGSTFKLVLDVRNETPRHAENVVVSLAGAAGAPAEGGSAAGGLTVLGTGNSKFIGTVRGRTTRPVTFKVVAGSGTPPGAATIPVTVSFEYAGERHEVSHTIGLVFEREVSLRVSAAEVPRAAKPGEPFEASFELANASGFALQGLSLGVTADAAKVTDGTIFVGGLDPAATETIDVTINPEEAGEIEVVFVATYRDDLGKEQTFSKSYPVDVEGEPQPSEDVEPGDSEPKSQGGWISRFFMALIGLGS